MGYIFGPGMYPGSSHHDGYHRSQAPHYGHMEDRETIMLAVGGSPRVYGSYPLHSGSPDLFNRSGVYGHYHPQSGSPEHPGHGTVGIGLQSHGMDIMLSHERPVLRHGRDGYHGIHQEFGEQRGGWAGRDRVHLSMPIDASDNRSPTSIYRTGVELQNSNTSITSWGHHPRHGAWGSISSGDTPMGIYEADASSSIHRPATLLEKSPRGIMLEGELKNRYMEEIKGGAGHAGETKNSIAARRAGDGNQEVLKNEKQPESHRDMVNSKENHVAGKDAAGAAESIDSLSKDTPYQKQEDMPFPAENLTRKEVLADSESSEKGRNGWVGRSPRGGGDRQPPSSVSVIESGTDQPKQATIIIVGRYQLEQDNRGAVSGINETKNFSRPVPETAVSPAVGFAQLLSKSAEVQVSGAEVSSHQGQSAYQTPKALEEVGGGRAENSEEPPKMVPAANVAIQIVKESPKGGKNDLKFSKGNNDIQIVDDDSKSRVSDAAKSTNVRKKMPMSCKSTRGTKKDGLPLSLLSERKGATGVSEESLLSSQTSERNRVKGSTSSCAGSSVFSGEKPNSAVLSAVEVTRDATHACSESGKKVYTNAYSNSVSDADQVEGLKHTETEASFKDENEVPLKLIDDFVVKACEKLSVPSSKEEVQVCNDDGPNKKTKRKAHSLKRFQRDHSLLMNCTPWISNMQMRAWFGHL